MRIQHNIMSMNAYRNYNTNTSALSKNLEKLSSGYKINRAGDDAAGLAISEKMRAQITGLNAAQKNVKDGISLVKTAEGAMQEIQDMLNRMDYLATQSANGTYDDPVDRKNLQKEVDALKTEINRIADSANFNGIKLLDGSQAENVSSTTLSINASGTAVGGNAAAAALANSTITYTPGTKATGGAVSFPDANFVTAAGHYGIHEGQPANKQVNPTFTINLEGLKVTSDAVAGSAVTVSISFGGMTISVSINGKAGGLDLDAAALASAIATAAQGSLTTAGWVEIGGVNFKMTASGSEINFALATATNLTASAAASINAVIQGADVNVTAAGTGTKTTVVPNHKHGLENINLAKAAKDGELAGISLTLDDKIVKQGNVLKVGNHEFVFQTTTASLSAASGQTVIDVSGKKTAAEQYAEAARQMAQAASGANQITHDGTKFEISLVNSGAGNVIHFDQIGVTAGGDDVVYDEDKLKSMFSLTEATTAAQKGSITVNAGALGISANIGDRFVLNESGVDKVYEIVDDAAASAAAGKLTAASFAEKVQNAALNYAKDVAEKTYGDIYKFQVSGTAIAASVDQGVAGVDDTATKSAAVANTIKNALGKFTVAKAGSVTVDTSAAVSGTAAASVGDKFMMDDGTSYTIVATEDEATPAANYSSTKDIKITASDFSNIQKKAILDAVVAEAKDKFGKFNFTISGTDAINVELNADKGTIGTTDGANQMNVIKDFLVNKLKSVTMNKVSAGDEGGLRLQIGDTSDKFNQMSVQIGDMHTKAMGNGKTTLNGEEIEVTSTIADIDISNLKGAQDAIAVIKNAINYVSGIRGDLGAIQNRLEHTANNLSVMAENIQDAESTIRDTDIAEEMMAYTKNNILVQSAQAMLAQANAVPQGVLQLLG